MKKILIRRLFALVLAVGLTILLIMLFTSGSEPKTEYTYTVQKGDTLYSIAEDLQIENWRRFAHETCENNGLEQGGLIFTGQEIVICY